MRDKRNNVLGMKQTHRVAYADFFREGLYALRYFSEVFWIMAGGRELALEVFVLVDAFKDNRGYKLLVVGMLRLPWLIAFSWPKT